MASNIPAGDRKIVKLFFTVYLFILDWLSVVTFKLKRYSCFYEITYFRVFWQNYWIISEVTSTVANASQNVALIFSNHKAGKLLNKTSVQTNTTYLFLEALEIYSLKKIIPLKRLSTRNTY